MSKPVAWRHSLTHCLYETEESVPLADGDESAQPLFLGFTEEQRDYIKRAISFIDFRWGPEDLVIGLRDILK